MNFSFEQKSAITHTLGPALVLAGPGSGKTRVIVQRLQFLQKKYPYSKILSLTFSRAAAQEMERRFEELNHAENTTIHFSTIHSLGFSILQSTFEKTNTHKIIGGNQIEIIKKIFYQVNNCTISSPEAENIVNTISRSRNLANNTVFNNSIQIKNFNLVYQEYEHYKKEHRLLDYDDLLFLSYDILKTDRKKLDFWSNRYDFIQVDEAQDLTTVQFDIIYKVASKNNIFVVADDDQSIYGFRGAQPQCLNEFSEHFNNCVKFHLSNNYRSAPEIVNFSAAIISKNENRFVKKPNAATNVIGKIDILQYSNSVALGKFIYLTIEKDFSQASFGVLYRNNYCAVSVAAVLIKQGLTVSISGNHFPISQKYINLFLIMCLKKGLHNTKPLSAFFKLKDEFRRICIAKSKNTTQECDNIDATIDFFHTICSLCSTYAEAEDLIQLVRKQYEESLEKNNSIKKNQIFLSTIHSSKGLEYDNVFIIDLNKNHFPGKSSETKNLLEEERRLFYVAVTRAKQSLYLMYSKYYAAEKQEESIFITESRKAIKGV